ncbi:hypothetical protein [Pseudophaeobacter sp.]|uniref:hypothetical protein n=1 Tax=Pseudophaeobacter sp. TaxID=1971739 RepID=UPI0040583F59
MKTLIFLAATAIAVLWFLNPETLRATARPEQGLEITLAISPMFGIHSDWHRSVEVSFQGQTLSKELMSDTGWWRGSNLYRHSSGAYVVHEGQGGCFSISVDPLKIGPMPGAICLKGVPEGEQLEGHSKFYSDMVYLGHFMETWRDENGVRIQYVSSDRISEVELPDGP